jgi:hypothetical protein
MGGPARGDSISQGQSLGGLTIAELRDPGRR